MNEHPDDTLVLQADGLSKVFEEGENALCVLSELCL
jgi:hypothetical protein